MPDFDESAFSLDGFAGRARLFPLPNLVLFPHIMQPLHVFEPRYRELLEDALADDRLVTMALLQPGWEADYEGRPPLYPDACLGRVMTHHRLDDGTYNMLLLGLRRVRLVRELEPRRRYREAEVVLREDREDHAHPGRSETTRRRLRAAVLQTLPALGESGEQLDQLLSGGVSLGLLTDLVGYILDIALAEKIALLGELDVERRAERLIDALSKGAVARSAAGAIDPFPPPFSHN